MADLATLGIVVNYKENVNVSKRLKDIQREAGKTEKTTKKLFQSKADKHLAELKKVAKSYSDADRAAKLHWEGINRQTRKVQENLRQLQKQNVAAFDREDIRLYRKELGATETALRKLKGIIPDREFQRLQHQISQSRRELTKHHTSMNKFNAVTATATRVTSKFRLALASAFALLGSALIIKNTLDSAAAIKQQADMAGVSATALQELSFAAQQYKVSNDALVDGLKELNLRADEFIQTGKGPAAEAFKRLGYEEDELNEKLKESDKLFVDIIKRMQGLDTAAKIRIADEIFGGRGGEQFASLVNAGADSIEAMRKEAQRLGIVLSDEVVNNSNDATKALQTLGKQLKAQFTNLIAELAPEIEAAATNITEWIAANKKLLSQDIPKFLGSVTTGMIKLISATNKLITSTQIITKAFYDPAGAAELFRKEMEKTNEEIRNSVTIPFVDPRTKKTVEENTKALEGALKVVRGMAKPDEMPAVLDPEMIREAKQLWEQTRTPLENLYSSLERLNKLWEAGALSQEEYFRAIEMHGEKFTDTFKKAAHIAEAEQKQTLKKVSTMWDRTLENIQDNTGTVLYAEIETSEEEWENFDTICDSTFKERSPDTNRSDSIRPQRQYIPALQSQAA